LFISLCR